MLGNASQPNYIINSNFEKNTHDVIINTPSSALISKVCTGPEVMSGKCSLRWLTSSSSDYLKFKARTMNVGKKGAKCASFFEYQYDNLGVSADTVTARVEDSSGTVLSETIRLTATTNSLVGSNDGTRRVGIIRDYTCKPNDENRVAVYHGSNNSIQVMVDEVHTLDYPLTSPTSMKVSTNEQTYTPTYTGFGTVSTSNMKWYQDGGYLYIYGTFVTGTGTAVEARMSLPTGYTSSSTLPTLSLAGELGRPAASAVYFRSVSLIEPSVTYITFGQQDSTRHVLAKQNGNIVTAPGETVYVNAKIPIAGASNLTAVPASLTNTPRTQYTPTFTGFGTVTTHECFKSTEGEFGYIDCKFTAGTSTAVEGRVSLPSEWTVPTWSQGIRAVGTVGALSATGAVPVIQLESGSTYVTFGFQGGSNAGQSKLNGSSMLNSGQSITFTAKIPLANKVPNGGATIGAGAIFSNSLTNQFRYEDAFVSGGNPPTILNPTTSGWLVFSTRTAAGDYTFTHSFGVQPKCGITPIAATRRFARFQTLNSTTIRVTIEDSAGAGTDTDFTIWCTVAR